MNLRIKPLYLSSALALALVGCGSASKMVSTPVENIDKMPLKTTPLAEKDLQRWSHLDLTKDTVPGMSVDKAYAELLKGKKGQKVIVGIVDSGVDINHEDLKSVIWTNPKEIAGNKIDDDKNGYVDDIHGWNFLGDAVHEQLEMTRIVKKGPGTPDYDKAKAQLDEELQNLQGEKQQLDMILNADKALKNHLKKDNYTLEDIKKIESTDQSVLQAKAMYSQILTGMTKAEFDKEIEGFKDYVYGQLNYNLNVDFDGRKIVGDNPDDIKDTKYGNNNVVGPEPKEAKHGTHVAGIVAQVRGNKKGGDGVANNVAIMAVRAVPNGDEYDKDIALGIRYAVDNGAKVINGSFGKYFSQHSSWVVDAIKYAASKDVLVIFAAGNDSKDLDKENKFPTDSYNNEPEFANNVLIIGALNVDYGSKMVAGFSNYGKNNVDIFAPGMKIYATTPLNTYEYLQGTSMASPNVAGVAALIRSYYPSLTANQVKQIIMESGTSLSNTISVGEDKHKASFSDVSKTGKIVNAYNALIMAEKMAKK
ncbi:S8 family peptidase [Flavobacterium urocaniciphilum]|uniref:Subtilase family protein n=1 Tax=Flavobacterium urocaniciphilum TaxID=1299341 RepID=A0A1H9BWW1_9FLAO|nr:S8 family peptidase [Flavobacterium urocaniciphilum]SEP92838.1 Subtilase family protein [Flavobacterium urocaniciphilum]